MPDAGRRKTRARQSDGAMGKREAVGIGEDTPALVEQRDLTVACAVCSLFRSLHG